MKLKGHHFTYANLGQPDEPDYEESAQDHAVQPRSPPDRLRNIWPPKASLPSVRRVSHHHVGVTYFNTTRWAAPP
jgi:hypothetical protein